MASFVVVGTIFTSPPGRGMEVVVRDSSRPFLLNTRTSDVELRIISPENHWLCVSILRIQLQSTLY